MRVAVQSAVNHHVEGGLGLGDPAHAVGQAGRPQASLTQEVPLAPPAQHVLRRYPQIGDADLAVVVASRHGLYVADDLPAGPVGLDDEGRVGGLGEVGVVLGAGDEDGELGSPGPGDEPLVAVDHPLVAVLVGASLDERGVGAGDLGLGHGEARPGDPVAQRP